MAKNLVLGPILAHLAKILATNLALSVTKYSQLSSCTIPEKTNNPILKKLNHGQTARQWDRQTDGEWFITTLSD